MNNVIEEQIEFIENLIEELKKQRSALIKRQRKEALDEDMILLFNIVKDNPGIDRASIEEHLATLLTREIDYNNKMTALVRHKKIVNMGSRRKPLWYSLA